MKKITSLFLMLLIFSNITFSQETHETFMSTVDTLKTIQDSTTSNAERLIDKYSAKFVNGFTSMIQTVIPTAKEGFLVVVKLQIAKGIVSFIPLFLAILFLILTYREYNLIDNILKSENTPEYMDKRRGPLYEDNINPKLVTFFFLFIFLGFTSVFTISDGILHMVAPEWYAIIEIMSLFK
jgi:hypothetical protein